MHGMRRRAAVTAAAVAVLSVGAFAVAPPAAAVPGSAVYTCHGFANPVAAEFERDSVGKLVVTLDVTILGSATMDLPPTVYGLWKSSGGISFIGYSPLLLSAPTTVVLTGAGPSANCVLIDDFGGWPA